MTDTPTRLDISTTDAPRLLVLAGEVDAYTATSLQERLDALGTDDDVALDLDEVSFIDSSGLRAIISGHQQLEAAGKKLVLHRVSPPVMRLLDIVGLASQLHLADG